MHKKISRELNLHKTAVLTILSNALQILAALGALALSLATHGQAFTGRVETMLMAAIALVVSWGAILDIREATKARQVGQEADSLEEALSMLEQQQATLRAQRHDFMNHIQVVYSLLEMQEYGEAMQYIERIYGDILRVSSVLKTSIPAVNALLAAKHADCEEHGIAFETDISSPWNDSPMPGWELCRVLSNLIDNARDAILETGSPSEHSIRVALGETPGAFTFCVSNDGPPIPPKHLGSIFQMGFTTKADGHGSGLSIVSELMREFSGHIDVQSDEKQTRFTGTLPKQSAP